MVRPGRPPLVTQRIWQKYGSVSHTDASDAYHNMSYDIAKETCPYQTDLVRLRTFVRLMEAIPDSLFASSVKEIRGLCAHVSYVCVLR